MPTYSESSSKLGGASDTAEKWEGKRAKRGLSSSQSHQDSWRRPLKKPQAESIRRRPSLGVDGMGKKSYAKSQTQGKRNQAQYRASIDRLPQRPQRN